MTDAKDGGPAFPHTRPGGMPGMPAESTSFPGMSLRDWFAGQALAGLVSNDGLAITDSYREQDATRCYAMADAMLAARSRHD